MTAAQTAAEKVWPLGIEMFIIGTGPLPLPATHGIILMGGRERERAGTGIQL